MSHRRHSFTAALAAALLIGAALLSPVTSLPLSGSASADAPIVLGGGSGITVDGSSLCTLTAIGNDRDGNLIGFTSAHCGGPGAQVGAEGAEDRGPVGTMVAGNEGLDYAVIQFDPAKVTPTDTVNGFRIDGIGPDPTFGAVSCKLGRSTGQSCGVTWGPGKDPGTIVSQMCGAPGDSGAPVTVDNRLVGMIHGAFSQDLPGCVTQYVPLHTPAVAMSFAAQMADITAKNRPGTGFVPTKQSA